MKKIFLTLILITQLLSVAWAETFVVKNIKFDGLQRISPATARSYLPIKTGQKLKPAKTAAIMKSLYKTGFFDHIKLSRQGSTLVVHVVERPTIGKLSVKGNSIIPTDKLMEVMKSLDIAEGRVYNASMLEKIRQSLLNQYYLLGRYNARVKIHTNKMSRNRLNVVIDISEGLVSTVKRITIIGNKVFKESTLVSELDLSTSGIVSMFTQSDRYSDEKLQASLDKLRGYYMDHGYLQFQVKSAQAQVTPDRKSVYITIVIDEGQPYTVKGFRVEGKLPLPRKEVLSRVQIQKGELFSRKKIMATEKDITQYFADHGYLFTRVAIRPEVNKKSKTVVLVFMVNSGKRIYVRNITFSDNKRTNDVVLRRELTQFEAAPASMASLKESKRRINVLPYIKNVDMSINPVKGKKDQIDVNYKVEEDNSAQATFKVGYSQVYRVILGAGLNQKNFMGTGNTLGINLQRSKFEQFYGIDYTDPYYTLDGISRSLSFAVSKTDPGAADSVTNGYTSNEYAMSVLYGIPIGQEHGVSNRIMGGVGVSSTLVSLIAKNVSAQINDFVTQNGRRYDQADLKLGYSRNSLDKAIFPTKGTFQSAFVDVYLPVTSSGVSFYTMNYHGKWYYPLSDEFIFLARGDFGYGNGFSGIDKFPFFKNYFAGGIDSVRGYLGYTLGPRDSRGQAFGGNMLADASIAMIFPNYLSDSLRTSVFFDAGNVYVSRNNRNFGGQSTNSGPIRYAAGVEADFLTPMGPIELSLSKAINTRPGDRTEPFQFSLGANF